MTRLQSAWARLQQQARKAFIAYITVGDPDLPTTIELMHVLVERGADLIELGVPFSDPMADGPVIQRAMERALKNHTGLGDVLDVVRLFRTRDHVTPVILMGYANPVEAMGQQNFVVQAAEAGVDGVLTVDYPPEECQSFIDLLNQYEIAPIFLIAPTTEESRIQQIVRVANGFIYYVSLRGVTGAKHLDMADVQKKIAVIRRHTKLPVVIGFGVVDASTAKLAADVADGVVVGSRIVQEVESSPRDQLLDNLSRLITTLRSQF